MKIYIIIITIGLLSCNNQQKQLDNSSVNTLDKKISKADNSKYITHLDTILIATEIGDTLKYTKTEFNKIVNTHTEFFEEYPVNPDQTYSKANDKEEFIEAIQKLLSDEAFYYKIAEAGKKLVFENFNWANSTAKLMEIFES